MDMEAWHAAVPGVAKSWTQLSDWTEMKAVLLIKKIYIYAIYNMHILREYYYIHPWRRKQLLTPVFWPGEFHGQYSPWGLKEWNTTERLSLSHYIHIIYVYKVCNKFRVECESELNLLLIRSIFFFYHFVSLLFATSCAVLNCSVMSGSLRPHGL